MAHFNIPCNGWIVHCIPLVLTMTAFILSCVATRSCEFLSSQNEVSGLIYWGIFRYQSADNGPCLNINFQNGVLRRSPDGISEDFDLSQPDFLAAQIGAVVATSIGFCSVSLLFVSLFRPIPARIFRYANACLLLLAMIGCGLSFQLFEIYFCGEGQILDEKSGEYRDVEGRCFIEGGGTRMAAALVLYLIAALFLMYMEAPSVAMFEFVRYEALKTREDAEAPRELGEVEAPELDTKSEEVKSDLGAKIEEVVPDLDEKRPEQGEQPDLEKE